MRSYVIGQLPTGIAPLPPQNVLVNGARYPANISGEYTISWCPQPRKSNVGCSGIEAGTTYTVRLYDETNTLRKTVTGLTANSYTWNTEVADSGLGDYSTHVLADSPISYWKLNETSGTTAADSAGSNAGTYTGGFTLNQSGIPAGGSSVLLNGTSGYVNCGAPSSLNITAAWTLEAWVWLNSTPNGAGLIAEDINPDSKVLYTLGFGNDTGGSVLATSYYTGSYYAEQADSTLSNGAWHHCVGTWDGTTLKIYRDNALISSGAKSPGPSSSMSNISLGKRHDNSYSPYLSARIAHCAIYPTALSSTRISDHYAAGISAPRRNASVRAEIESVNAGVTSYQKQNVTVTRSDTSV